MARPLMRSSNAGNNAWRNKGFSDGYAGKEASPPDSPTDAQARRSYMDGHRAGCKERIADGLGGLS